MKVIYLTLAWKRGTFPHWYIESPSKTSVENVWKSFWKPHTKQHESHDRENACVSWGFVFPPTPLGGLEKRTVLKKERTNRTFHLRHMGRKSWFTATAFPQSHIPTPLVYAGGNSFPFSSTNMSALFSLSGIVFFFCSTVATSTSHTLRWFR